MLVWIAFAAILLFVSVGDFLFFRIEDEYSLALMILYAVSFLHGTSGGNFNVGLTVAVATFIITWILNRFDLIGGGDVKLLFPTILLCENNLSAFWFGLSFGGGALALVYLFFGRRIILIRRNLARRLRILHKRPIVSKLLRIILLSLSRVDGRIATLRKGKFDPMKQEIPYGAAIACGGFYAIFENLAVR